MNTGKKFDTEKANWFLLPMESVSEIVKVMTFGANKYGKANWKLLANCEERYFSAAMRHLEAWQSGQLNDEESGLPHLAHAACNIIFLLWFSKTKSFNNVFDLTNFGS